MVPCLRSSGRKLLGAFIAISSSAETVLPCFLLIPDFATVDVEVEVVPAPDVLGVAALAKVGSGFEPLGSFLPHGIIPLIKYSVLRFAWCSLSEHSTPSEQRFNTLLSPKPLKVNLSG